MYRGSRRPYCVRDTRAARQCGTATTTTAAIATTECLANTKTLHGVQRALQPATRDQLRIDDAAQKDIR